MCFYVLKRSWKTTCHPFDGTFLRGTMKGQLLVIIGRDGCNKMYHIVWGIAGVDDEKNKIWLIRRLKFDLDLGNGEGFVIMSNRQKGLINVGQKEIPHVEDRKFVRHIYGYLEATHGKKMKMKPFIWLLAWSYNKT